MNKVESEKTRIEITDKKALIIRLLKIFLIVFLVIGFFRIFIFEIYFIPSNSMSDTLLPGDFVVVSRLSYFFGIPYRLPMFNVKSPVNGRIWYRDVKRGDAIVFGNPDPHQEGGGSQTVIKRVVAVPGDSLTIIGNFAYVNHERQELPPQSRTWRSLAMDMADTLLSNIVVPKKGLKVYPTPDNISIWKPVIENEGGHVYERNGRIYLNDSQIDTYIVKEDYYYVMGDNRNLSSDSRQWGFLPENNIIGKPLFIFLSFGAGRDSDKFLRINRIGKSVH